MVDTRNYDYQKPDRQMSKKSPGFNDFRINPLGFSTQEKYSTSKNNDDIDRSPYYPPGGRYHSQPPMYGPAASKGKAYVPPLPPPPPPPPDYPSRALRPTADKKYSVLDHFGIYLNIPSLNILKLCSIIVLTILVALNIIINLETSEFLPELVWGNIEPRIEFGLIGICLGFLFRYYDFESEQLKELTRRGQKLEFKNYLVMVLIVIIMIFIILMVFVELIFSRGYLFLVDVTNISIMALGTYTIFSGKRNFIILTILLIFIIMLIGVDSGPNIPLMLLLGMLTVIYIEVTDGVCLMQERIEKFNGMIVNYDPRAKFQLNVHLDEFTIKFAKNLGFFMILTVIISSLFMLLYVAYPLFTPPYMNENLEMQTVYSMLPVIFFLFFVFMIIYLFTPNNSNRYDYDYEPKDMR